VIPDFTADGLLPAGVHSARWDEIAARFGTGERRRTLLTGFKQALDSLETAGCRKVFLNGSFVTDKQEPNDFDACWEISGVDGDQLDPVLLDFTNRRAAQKAKYGGELFPAEAKADPAGTRFRDYFQRDRTTGNPKGIIAIDLGGNT
jgi:hypothetical protein